MDRIVGPSSMPRMVAMLSSPIHKYELAFFLEMEHILTQLMSFECINKTDFRYQIAKIHQWYHARWLAIQKMKDPEFVEFESDRPPPPKPPTPKRTMSMILQDMQATDWKRMTKEEQFWQIFND